MLLLLTTEPFLQTHTFVLNYMFMCVSLGGFMHLSVVSFGGQKRVSDPLERELQMVVVLLNGWCAGNQTLVLHKDSVYS